MKKGDTVKIIAGKDKGKTGVVLQVLRERSRVVVEGINMLKHFVKPKKAGEKGGMIELPASLHISNVKLADKK